MHQVLVGCDFESTAAWHDAFVVHCVLDCSQSISDGFFGLGNLVVVGTFDQDCAREWVLNSLDERVFVVAKDLLVDNFGEAEVSLGEVVNGIDLPSSASEWDSLTISLLRPSDANDVVSGQNLERRRVNSFLVDHDEVIVGAVAQLSLQFNDLLNFIVSESPLRLNQFLSLLGI